MPRKSMLLGAGALVTMCLGLSSLVPASVAAESVFDDSPVIAKTPYLDSTAINPAEVYREGSPTAVEPDVAYDRGGARIEVYGSRGNLDGSYADWRQVNAYARLVASVPREKQLYSTVYNSLWDNRGVHYVADPSNPGQGTWEMKTDAPSVFSPTVAFLHQVNQYQTQAERLQYLHVLGNRGSIDYAAQQGSSLASLLKATSPKALDYHACSKGSGACLTNVSKGENLMHAKYAAFEQAEDASGHVRDNVVWITSANLNGASGGKKANVSIAIYDDAKAYAAVKNIYEAEVGQNLNAATPAAQAFREALTVGPDGLIKGMSTDSGITLYPSPRALTMVDTPRELTQTDVEAGYLNQQAASGGNKPGCKVYAVHSLFSGTRKDILETRNDAGVLVGGLAKLQDQQCDVKIVLGENALTDIVDTYFAMSTSLRDVIGSVEFGNVHDKTLSYSYGDTNATFGGSSNFNGTSLDYDELAFRGIDARMTGAVQEHSERVYQLARGRTTWTSPTSATVSPSSSSSNPLTVVKNESVQLGTRVAPDNALVTNITWSHTGGVTVTDTGKVTGVSTGPATVTATISSPHAAPVSATAHFKVVATEGGTTSKGSGPRAVAPPVLTMERYQAPPSIDSTSVTVTWGSGSTDYDGVVKLQYYSGGKWKTYCGSNPSCWVMVKNGVGHKSFKFKGSHTWRAYGARLDSPHGSTAKTMSTGYSIVTVRSRNATTTPRLYATNAAKSGSTVPFLLSWKRPSGYSSTFRLQYLVGKRTWRTAKTFNIAPGVTQTLFSLPIIKTHKWRVATTPTKISNSVTVAMK